jgi:tetratricopeptide (TPR) repeat protein
MDSLAQSATVSGNDNIVVQAIDSVVNVKVGPKPYLRLTQYERRTKLAARDNTETALLSAYRADVVPLVGRDGALADLRAWLDMASSVSVRVLVGAGGRGKTRLALELAREIAKDQWLAGFATAEELDRFRGQHAVEQWRWDKPALIILDYAASRADQLRAWVQELVDASLEERPKLRLLLLERQANRSIGWLAKVFGQGDNDASRAAISLLDPKEPIELPALDDIEFRRQVFGTLLAHANGALDAPAKGADPEFDRLLSDRKWAGDPLYLMMAGLAAAQAGVKSALTLSRANLALTIGRNELDRIGRIGTSRGVDEKHRFPGAFVRHMAAIATLLQGLTIAEAREIAASEMDALRWAADLNATVDALTDALPASDTKGSVAPILPDIVGEAAILAWFGANSALETGGVDAAGRIVKISRASVGEASATLMRIAQDFAEAGHAEPIQWLDALAGAPETDLGALIEIASALPDSTIVLRQLGADLFQRIAHILRGSAKARRGAGSDEQLQYRLAYALDNLGVRLSALGRLNEAVVAAREAADISRRLAAARPDAFLPELARSLSNLGGLLAQLGRREEAVAAAQEGADISRRLAAASPDAFLPDLARSLSSLGNVLSELAGRREDALAATQEATDIRRRLTAERPDASLPDLALSLNNLGSFLSGLGRREEGLAAAQEAVDIYRRLAAAQPDAFLPDLARSLNSLGNRLSESGRHEEAVAAGQEAVDIRRRLAAAQPDAFLPDLASSLNRLGNRLSDHLGRHEEAHAAAQQAVDIYRRLAASRPDAFLPDLAQSLNDLGAFSGQLGRREEGIAAAREAVDIYRRLAAARPDDFRRGLAQSLHNLGIFLSGLGHNEAALPPALEAVDIRRRIAAASPDDVLSDLAQSLLSLSNVLHRLGRRDEALTSVHEATDVSRRLAAARPAFLSDLALSLTAFVSLLSELGRREDALDRAQEAVDVYRRLAAERPDEFLPQLAAWLDNLEERLREVGRPEDAVAATQEVVDVYRRLAAARADAFLPPLAFSLDNLGGQLSQIDRHADALAAGQEAVDICRRLAEARPDAFLPHLAPLLDNLGNHLSNVGRREDALATGREATETYRTLVAARPDAFLPDFALSLNNLSQTYEELGRSEDALAAAHEALVTLAPVFLESPAAHRQWMTLIARKYLELSKNLVLEPDLALLGPIADAFEKLRGAEQTPNLNA